MSVSETVGPSANAVDLQRRIMRLRRPDNRTNLLCLAREYACLVLVIGAAVAFAESRAGWGLSWLWNLPVFALAIVLVGGLQHRLAGLGHEASHYSFLKNRYANDLVADLFCMFPIFTSVHFYRLFHMAHHQHTNDPEKDPDLLNLGRGKRAFEFPMSRKRFIAVVYFCVFVAPIRFMEYQFAYWRVNVLGKGRSIYNGTAQSRGPAIHLPWPATALGFLYMIGLGLLFTGLWSVGRTAWIVPAALLAGGLATVVLYLLPGRMVFQSPFRQVYSTRFSAGLRLWCYTAALAGLAVLGHQTGGRSFVYAFLLWNVPVTTTFPFYMLLRDVYQHSNADSGRLTNSRVFFADPFTRWAVFIYGQDMHIPHHLYPTVPHYRLAELHQLLKANQEEYDRLVIECQGTFQGSDGRPSILDEMTKPHPPLGAGGSLGA